MKAIITFTHCLIDDQQLGTDEYMISRVFFDIVVDGQRHTGLQAHLKQVVGSDYESGPIEVGSPEGYRGAFNYNAFRDLAERYFRHCVGANAKMIRVGGGAQVRLKNCGIYISMTHEFEIDPSSGGW